MYTISKVSKSPVIDYAAEELKKYLMQMSPECGGVRIVAGEHTGDAFRLGVMSELGLDTSEVRDASLDDILYFDCGECGGVIAGSNPRAVLLSVYEYLRALGCHIC